jgi:hypothetical protein
MRFVPVLLLFSCCFAFPAAAEEKTPRAVPFAVYPVATELQRLRLGRSADEAARLRAYVVIQGNGIANEHGLIDPQALPAEEIRKALAPYADREKGIVSINLHYGNESDGRLITPPRSTDELLDLALDGLGRRSGFSGTVVSRSIGGPLLEAKFSQVTDKVAGQADEDETPVGDELVKVYPVRTILSLLLTENADCVIDIPARLKKDGENLFAPELRAAIVKHVSTIKLRDKQKVQISVKYRLDRITRERFDNFATTEAAELGKSLGFKTWSVLSSAYAGE